MTSSVAKGALGHHYHHGGQHLLYRPDPSYASIGIWAPILLLLAKLAQGFSVGGEYSGAAIFVAEYSPDRKRGFMGSWLDFGSIAGFVMGAGVVVLISSIVGEANFLDWGWRIPFFIAAPLGLIGLYLRHALEETPAFQQHVDKMEKEDRNAIENPPKPRSKRSRPNTGKVCWCASAS